MKNQEPQIKAPRVTGLPSCASGGRTHACLQACVTGDLRSFFETEKKEIDSQPNRIIWNYVLLPQNIFEELEVSGLRSLIDKCDANLALLKMRKE